MTLLKNRELLIGILLTLIGLVFLVVLIPYGIVEPKRVKYAAMSPSFYPRLVGIAFLLMSLAISVRAFMGKTRDQDPDDDLRQDATIRIVFVFLVLALMSLAFKILGFVLTATMAMAVLMWFAGERRYWLIGILSIVVPLGLYFFFVKVALIPIPAGILKSLLVGG
jgi:putative tricarboxylic transport membrane protein